MSMSIYIMQEYQYQRMSIVKIVNEFPASACMDE